MKGLKKLSEQTQSINFRDRASWVKLYYSIKEDTVYSGPGDGRYFICNLINPNSEYDIKKTVNQFLDM